VCRPDGDRIWLRWAPKTARNGPLRRNKRQMVVFSTLAAKRSDQTKIGSIDRACCLLQRTRVRSRSIADGRYTRHCPDRKTGWTFSSKPMKKWLVVQRSEAHYESPISLSGLGKSNSRRSQNKATPIRYLRCSHGGRTGRAGRSTFRTKHGPHLVLGPYIRSEVCIGPPGPQGP